MRRRGHDLLHAEAEAQSARVTVILLWPSPCAFRGRARAIPSRDRHCAARVASVRCPPRTKLTSRSLSRPSITFCTSNYRRKLR